MFYILFVYYFKIIYLVFYNLLEIKALIFNLFTYAYLCFIILF